MPNHTIVWSDQVHKAPVMSLPGEIHDSEKSRQRKAAQTDHAPELGSGTATLPSRAGTTAVKVSSSISSDGKSSSKVLGIELSA